jgi:hypothetical protein
MKYKKGGIMEKSFFSTAIGYSGKIKGRLQ